MSAGTPLADKSLQPGHYTMVPAWLFARRDVSVPAKMLYIYILLRADQHGRTWRGMGVWA